MAKAITANPQMTIEHGRFMGPAVDANRLPVGGALLIVLDLSPLGDVRFVDGRWVTHARKSATDPKMAWKWRKQCRGCPVFAWAPMAELGSRSAQLHLELVLSSLLEESETEQ